MGAENLKKMILILAEEAFGRPNPSKLPSFSLIWKTRENVHIMCNIYVCEFVFYISTAYNNNVKDSWFCFSCFQQIKSKIYMNI